MAIGVCDSVPHGAQGVGCRINDCRVKELSLPWTSSQPWVISKQAPRLRVSLGTYLIIVLNEHLGVLQDGPPYSGKNIRAQLFDKTKQKIRIIDSRGYVVGSRACNRSSVCPSGNWHSKLSITSSLAAAEIKCPAFLFPLLRGVVTDTI